MATRRQKRYAVYLLVDGTDVEWYNHPDKERCENWIKEIQNLFPSLRLDFKVSTTPILTHPFENGQFPWVTKTLGVDYFCYTDHVEKPVIYLYKNTSILHSQNAYNCGWVIQAKRVQSEFYAGFSWVEEFKAIHPIHGIVFGDYQSKVYASTSKGFEHFHQFYFPNIFSNTPPND